MDKKINSLRFNNGANAFTCGMDSGVTIYDVAPLRVMQKLDVDVIGSVKLCGLVDRSNILWVVGGGPKPFRPDTCVVIFELDVMEYHTALRHKLPVTAVCMKTDKIVTSTAETIEIIAFPSFEVLMSIDTTNNSTGLLLLTPSSFYDKEIVVFPGSKVGSLRIVDITNIKSSQSSTAASLECHKNALACIILNEDGTLLATASVKGTIVRIWDTIRRIQLLELRRGCEPARIYSLSFDKTSRYLCCLSDKGTGHIFAIDDTKLNKQMALGMFLGKYGGGLKSFGTFQFPAESVCICTFGDVNYINVLGFDGTYNSYYFNTKGQCDRDLHDVFLNLTSETEASNT